MLVDHRRVLACCYISGSVVSAGFQQLVHLTKIPVFEDYQPSKRSVCLGTTKINSTPFALVKSLRLGIKSLANSVTELIPRVGFARISSGLATTLLHVYL